MRRVLRAAIVSAAALFAASACQFLAGAAVGGGATSGAYEYQRKQALDRLDKDFAAGRLTREQYLERKKELERGSVIY